MFFLFYFCFNRKMLLRVSFSGEQKYVRLSDLTLDAFLKEVCLKFDIPGEKLFDLKVYDQSDTQIDAEVFEEIVKESPGTFRVMMSNEELGSSLSPLATSSSASSDDTIILNFTMCDPAEDSATDGGSQPKKPCHINYEALALIKQILTTKPGGERIMQEYAKTKSLTDATRRQMINILAAEMTEKHGTSPPRAVRVMYAQGIVALFPYLEDPLSKHGYEHYYDPESGSGYLAWRLKTIQRKAAEEKGASVKKSTKIGGPGHGQSTLAADKMQSNEDVEAALAVLKHTADEDTIREKMRATFAYRNSLVNDDKTTDVFSVFPRFLDTPGLIEQDFRLLFGEETANKFLVKWPTSIKEKVIVESHRLVPTPELLHLLHNTESAAEDENGWDSDMSAILLLLHLLPPSAQGRKRPGKMSASQAADHLIRFLKAGTSVQQHLDHISQSCQPYLLAQGTTRSRIHTFFIVIDKHALPCKATGSVGALDELFKAHYVFGTSYSHALINFFTFLQTTVYNIDVAETKQTPRVAELRARMMR
uniref:Si:dkey-103d23.3 n=3 Tax=Nothobranchius TaxID=28779 RepID=A0A1A8NN88_9TELE